MNINDTDAFSSNSFDDSTDSEEGVQIQESSWGKNHLISFNQQSPNSDFESTKRCQRPILFFKGFHKKQGFTRQSCDNLICIKCDVMISRIDHMTWIDSIPDYMFFRSYFGNRNKIQTKLKIKNGNVAFYCGCQGVVLQTPSFINEIPNSPKWICNGCKY